MLWPRRQHTISRFTYPIRSTCLRRRPRCFIAVGPSFDRGGPGGETPGPLGTPEGDGDASPAVGLGVKPQYSGNRNALGFREKLHSNLNCLFLLDPLPPLCY